MKKEYTKPEWFCEEFIANEYISACWDINCNVPYGFGYEEKNNIPGYQEGGDRYIAGGASGCNTQHSARGVDAAGPAANAMWQPQKWEGFLLGKYVNDGDPYEVFYFEAVGHKGTQNHHFCTLDSVNWRPNPNASN